MKNAKQLFCLLLTLALLVGLMPMSALAAEPNTTIMLPNAEVAKLYTAADTAKETDLLSGVTKFENAYAVTLASGSYTLEMFDAQSVSLGTIVLTADGEPASFTVYAVSVTCENAGWVYGTDYTVTPEVRSGGDQATVVRTVTVGANGSFPCIGGDNVTALIEPSAAKKAEGYASAAASNGNDPSVVTGTGFAALTGICQQAAVLSVTYPYADTDSDGKNDFVLEAGTLGTYFIYSYFSADSETQPVNGQVTARFEGLSASSACFYRVTNPLDSSIVTFGDYCTLTKGSLTEKTVTLDQMSANDNGFNKKTAVRDFSKNAQDVADLYLSFGDECTTFDGVAGQLNLTAGQSATLYPFRNWLAVEGISNAKVIEPDFHVRVIDLDGTPITAEENMENNSAKHSWRITANSEGTALLLVTYDAMRDMVAQGGTDFSAIWPENTGVIVVNVGKDSAIATNMTINDTLNTTNANKMAIASYDAELDVLYYSGSDGASYSFKPEDGTTVAMAVCSYTADSNMTFGSFTSDGVSIAADGTVTLSGLTEGKTVVKLTNGSKVTYQILRAKHTDVIVKDADGNIFDADDKVVPGETVSITYTDVFHPANKLSGIYNMSAMLYLTDGNGTVIKGTGNQYAFASTAATHTVKVTIPADASDSYSLNGCIYASGFGSFYGMHRVLTYEKGKTANFTAAMQNGYMGRLPQLTLQLATSMDVGVSAVDENGAALQDADILITDFLGQTVALTEGHFNAYPGKTYTYAATAQDRVRVLGSFVPSAAVTSLKITIPVPTGDAWDGITKTEATKKDDVYQIGTGAELAWFAEKVNDGTAATTKAVLTADIELSNMDWTPIGTSTNAYTGTFDGQGHYITGLYINSTSTYQALFGYVNAGTIKNLGVSGQIKGGNYSAGVAAYLKGAAKVESCVNSVNVTGGKWTGGIAGFQDAANAAITNCYNTGSINGGANQYVGGISGGGANMAAKNVITNCYNMGTVYTTNSYAGSLNGCTQTANITNSYYLAGTWKGTAASNVNKAGTSKTAAELKTLVSDLGSPFMADPYGMNEGCPILTWQNHKHGFSEWARGSGTNAAYSRSCDCPICGKTFTEQSVMATVSYNAQYQGDYLFTPQREVSVDSTLAERYGYADSVDPTKNVSVLDVLVAAHVLKYGSAFTVSTAADYLAMGSYGSPDKQFGVANTTAYGGFLYNRAMANDGTKYDATNYNVTTVATQTVSDGDLVEFFFYEDPAWADTYNWFIGTSGYARTFGAKAGQPLELTLKGFGVMSASCFKDSAEMTASPNAAAIANAQVYTVNLTTGAKTAISNAVTDANGKVSLTFADAGTYTIAAYGTTDSSCKQLLSMTTVRVTKENEPQKNTITVSFRLIGAEKATQDVDLSVDSYLPDYVTWISTGSYSLDKNATVYDLFEQALGAAGLSSVGADSNYVSAITAPAALGGYALSEFTNGSYSGWMYSVNGSHPNVGLKSKHLSDGDVVIWHYVNDYRYEVADWHEGTVGTAAQQNLWLKAADIAPNSSDKKEAGQGGVSVKPEVIAKDGEAKAEITDRSIADAITAAKKDGSAVIEIAPVITGNADTVTLELPKTALKDIVSDTNASLRISTDVGSIHIPNNTLAEIVKAAGGAEISMCMEKSDTAAVKNQLPAGTITEGAVAVSFTITSGSKTISDFGGKLLTVSIPVDSKRFPGGKTYVAFIASQGKNIAEQTTAAVEGGAAEVSTSHFSTVVVTKEEVKAPFADITGHWAADAISMVYSKGLMTGVSADKFDPEGTLSRGMLVTILYRLAGAPAVTAANPFTDVKNGKWYTNAIIWASENKLVNGYGNGKFGPEDSITREQMAQILFAYTKLKGYDTTKASDLKTFTDAGKISSWAMAAVKWANAMNLINGRTATTIVPGGNATRAEAASILARYLKNVVK